MFSRTYPDGSIVEVRDNGDVYSKYPVPDLRFTDAEGWQYQETLPNHSGSVLDFVTRYGLSEV